MSPSGVAGVGGVDASLSSIVTSFGNSNLNFGNSAIRLSIISTADLASGTLRSPANNSDVDFPFTLKVLATSLIYVVISLPIFFLRFSTAACWFPVNLSGFTGGLPGITGGTAPGAAASASDNIVLTILESFNDSLITGGFPEAPTDAAFPIAPPAAAPTPVATPCVTPR